MRGCLTHVGGAGSSGQSSQEPNGKRRHSQSAGEDTGSGSPSDSGGNQENTYPIRLLKKEPECHMQLETLSPTRDHTVLIDVSAHILGLFFIAVLLKLCVSVIINHFIYFNTFN